MSVVHTVTLHGWTKAAKRTMELESIINHFSCGTKKKSNIQIFTKWIDFYFWFYLFKYRSKWTLFESRKMHSSQRKAWLRNSFATKTLEILSLWNQARFHFLLLLFCQFFLPFFFFLASTFLAPFCYHFRFCVHIYFITSTFFPFFFGSFGLFVCACSIFCTVHREREQDISFT